MHSTGAQTDPLLEELIPEISVLHCGFLQILKWQTATGTGVWIILRVRESCDFMAKKLKDNGYEGNARQIEQFAEKFDIEYFEEKCIECGWEILQKEVDRIFERRTLP